MGCADYDHHFCCLLFPFADASGHLWSIGISPDFTIPREERQRSAGCKGSFVCRDLESTEFMMSEFMDSDAITIILVLFFAIIFLEFVLGIWVGDHWDE